MRVKLIKAGAVKPTIAVLTQHKEASEAVAAALELLQRFARDRWFSVCYTLFDIFIMHAHRRHAEVSFQDSAAGFRCMFWDIFK